jgi:hypothetical protein
MRKPCQILISGTIVLLAAILVTGCTNPVVKEAPQAVYTTGTAGTPPQSPVPVVTTMMRETPIPQETPVQSTAYVSRPFGYVQYQYNPGHSVRLLDSHVETDPSGGRVVVGTIRNEGKERIDLVVATVNLFNADGYQTESTSVNTSYLGPGKTWKFRTAPIFDPDFRSHEIAEIFTG